MLILSYIMKKKYLISLGLLLLFNLTIFAKTYYVSPSGSNSNGGKCEKQAFL